MSLASVAALFPVINTAILVMVVIGLAYGLIQSRHWTGPGQAALFHQLRDELDMVRRTAESVDTALRSWREDYLETEKRLLERMRVLSSAVMKPQDQLTSRLADLEAAVRNLPCLNEHEHEKEDEG